MKLLLVFFLFFSTTEIKQIINKPVITDYRADVLFKKISDTYHQYGQVGVDAVLDAEPIWYGGIDLYINTDSDKAIEMLKKDGAASFHIAHSVAIETEDSDEYSIVMIVSF